MNLIDKEIEQTVSTIHAYASALGSLKSQDEEVTKSLLREVSLLTRLRTVKIRALSVMDDDLTGAHLHG